MSGRMFCRRFFLVPVLVFSLASLARAFEPKPVSAKVPLNLTMVQESGSNWQAQDGNFVLAERRPGLLEAPAWWTGNRPPAGEMAVLELEYQDNASQPVRAEVYSGMSIRDSYGELHRFGGLGDGAWKTARIPCAWDMIFRAGPKGTIRFRLVSDNGGITVRRARLVALQPDDEARYNAETREWVRRVQNRARVDSVYYARAQKPVLTGKWTSMPLVVFQRNWMNLVAPISAPQAGETDFPARVKLARNEYEPVQLGIYANGAALKGVRVTVDPIRDKSGKVVAASLVRVAEYAKVHGSRGTSIEPFPQRLWPAYPFDVGSGASHLVRVEIHTREADAVPGTYSTLVRVKAEGLEEVQVPLEVTIQPYTLLTMEQAGLKLGGCTPAFVPEHELAFLHENNHNMINIWYSGLLPELSKDGNSFKLDFQVMDEGMATAKRQGFNDVVYFLGGNPYSFPQTMHLERTLANTVLGTDDAQFKQMVMERPDSVLPKIAPLYQEWSRRFGEHARAQGYPNMILTPFDEPAKWVQVREGMGSLWYIKPHFLHSVELLRKGDPQVQIYGSIHHYKGGMDFLPFIDVFCTNAVGENSSMPDEVRAAGKTFWEYSGGITDKGLPANSRYTFGFYFAAHRSVGSLVWAYNWGNRFDTLDGSNWVYGWYTPFDVITTPFMEGLREAWDDRRLLETLKHKAEEKQVDISAFLNDLYSGFLAGRGRGGRSTLNDFWERATNEERMDLWREQMVTKLLEL